MHDRNGTPLQVGDRIMIEYEITAVSPGPDYCNISAKSHLTRKPDNTPEFFSGNSAVCVLLRRESGH